MNNQSSFIVGFLFLAFFIYITLKGELPIYAGFLLLSPANTGTNTAANTSAANAQQNATNQGANLAANAVINAGFAAFGL